MRLQAFERAARMIGGAVLAVSLFSTQVASAQSVSDLETWADPQLTAIGQPTLTVLEAQLIAAQHDQQTDCTSGCVDLAAVALRIDTALEALTVSACPLDIADPRPDTVPG